MDISGTLRGFQEGGGPGTERPHSDDVFRHALFGAPDVVASEIHMFPAQRGQVSEQGIRDVFDLSHNLDGAFEISGVPKDDRRDDEVETGGAIALVFEGPIADFAEAVKEHGPLEGMVRLAFVEAGV